MPCAGNATLPAVPGTVATTATPSAVLLTVGVDIVAEVKIFLMAFHSKVIKNNYEG